MENVRDSYVTNVSAGHWEIGMEHAVADLREKRPQKGKEIMGGMGVKTAFCMSGHFSQGWL
jgi:hypothetical protein